MSKGRRTIRLFFNTYYEEVASKIIERIKSLNRPVRVARSSVVPELYYVEVDAGEDDLEELKDAIVGIVKEAADDTVFGVKVYATDANR